MNQPHPDIESRSVRRRARLLVGVSVATLAATLAAGAKAQSLGALMAATHQATAAVAAATARASAPALQANSAGASMAAASARATLYGNQAATTLSLAQQAQAAAQAAAKAINQNAQAGVVDGLGVGGLQPAVTKITPVTADPTAAGVQTWQGAALPTANAANPNQVTVVQTAPRAVLSWTTFNVGQNTTLTFQQQQNGVAQPSWIALNRVVGQLDPATGLRNPMSAPAPSQILGSIKADGTVLVINQNGVIFGPSSQVNVNSLIATSLEVGRIGDGIGANNPTIRTVAQRDQEFLDFGLLGYAEVNPSAGALATTFSPQGASVDGAEVKAETNIEGAVRVEPGATLTSGDAGYLMLIAPKVINGGQLTAPDGEVALQSGRLVNLVASTGDANSVDPDVRGLVASATIASTSDPADYVDNTGIINVPRGYVSLGATTTTQTIQGHGQNAKAVVVEGGGVLDSGVILSTTSVASNGYVNLFGGDIQLSAQSYLDPATNTQTLMGAVISIGPDGNGAALPQDPTSLSAFKPSRIRIGDTAFRGASTPISAGGARIDIGAGSLIYAPSANIDIGAAPGSASPNDTGYADSSRVFVAGPSTTGGQTLAGAVIDAAGLPGVVVPASRNSIQISPVKGNELADSPAFRNGFLNGSTVYLDPRLSGVNANGVAWIGSPLISAAAYAQQVAVPVTELMTAGGNVTLGSLTYSGTIPAARAPSVFVQTGATIDISGGWKTYQAGEVVQTYLVAASGAVIPISQANPENTYIGIYKGYVATQPRWGISQAFGDPLLTGAHFEGQYTEGADAGSLTIKSSAIAIDGAVYGQAYAGTEQILNAQPGTATGAVYGDMRQFQAAPSQLPAGGYLNIQALSLDSSLSETGGGTDVSIVAQTDYTPLAAEVADLQYGQKLTLNPNGTLHVAKAPRPRSLLPADRLDTITLNADALSAMDLSQLSISTSGTLNLAADATITLASGGVFEGLAGHAFTPAGAGSTHAITVNGSIIAPSGKIDLTTGAFGGSVLGLPSGGAPQLVPGDFDIVVNGTLSVAGLWINDYHAVAGGIAGSAYQNGGEITLAPAGRVSQQRAETQAVAGCTDPCNVDVSGSIVINGGALIDVSGGGYVDPAGNLNLAAKGGSLSLFEDTTYFQLSFDNQTLNPGALSGFRVSGVNVGFATAESLNPDSITAHVSIADGAIQAHGFGGGGTFKLDDSSFSFGASDTATSGAALPLDFFSKTGFAAYDITTYATDLSPNPFTNGLGGYNAVLKTDVATVAAGQTLNLTQSYYSPILDTAQIVGLQGLASGSHLYSVVKAGVPIDAWDQKPVSLTLGGLTELHVAGAAAGAPAGQLLGAAGSALSVGELLNEGVIRLPGGSITQSEALPTFYAAPTYFDLNSNAGALSAVGVQALIAANGRSGVFSSADGVSVSENDPNALGILSSTPNQSGQLEPLTNAQAASTLPIYLLGDLPQGVGVRLAPGSITDLSGVAIVNPRASPKGGVPASQFADGKVVAGGSLTVLGVQENAGALFQPAYGDSVYGQQPATALVARGVSDLLQADGGTDTLPAATINLSGASATFDRPLAQTINVDGAPVISYGPTLIWSDAGSLTLGSGGTITGARISAVGGAPQASGGTLDVLNPILFQSDPASPTLNAIAADTVEAAGFDSFIAEGGLTSVGDVNLSLSRSFFVTTPTSYRATAVGGPLLVSQVENANTPVIGSGGALQISAPYIGLDGAFQFVSSPNPRGGAAIKTSGNSVLFSATAIDITGAVVADPSVAQLTLAATQDVRLIGVAPSTYMQTGTPPSTLIGQLAVNGDLTIRAGQVYPATGSTFALTSASPTGTISFQANGAVPSTPYSAGGNLLVLAANIDQDGVVRAPLGGLTLGATPASLSVLGLGDRAGLNVSLGAFAPPTTALTLGPDGVTSVSADGLDIPYGTTTDQREWYFSPTVVNPLTAPPAGALILAAASVSVQSGATVDLKGGGDVYAYEFISGTGGTRDVLDRVNSDRFSSNNGCQYPDCRQVYAIVPGLSDKVVAAEDPVYSSDYANLTSPAGVGESVYLSLTPGAAPQWYTLLPAKYAMLPGGVRIVQDTGASATAPGVDSVESDGTVVASGYFGVAGANIRSATPSVFDIQTQAIVNSESKIALTQGNVYFTALAAHNVAATPQLPIDAGRLIIDPVNALSLNAPFETTPASGGRGAVVDITGSNLVIDSATAPTAAGGGAITLTDASLNNLGAASLLLGGIRADNADGTTALAVTTNAITVANGASLAVPELILATDGPSSSLTVQAGATIVATGAVTGESSGDYVIDGLAHTGAAATNRIQQAQGGFLRVSNGPDRQLSRLDIGSAAPGSIAIGGTLTANGASGAGGAIEVSGLGAVSIDPAIAIQATSLSLGAGQIAFGANPAGSALLITPALESEIAKAQTLTLQSRQSILFASGTYGFGNLELDAPAIAETSGGGVTLNAGKLVMANSSGAGSGCSSSGAGCGADTLVINASQIAFASGALATAGFGGAVNLNAPEGIFVDGVASFDAGPAVLTLNTPFLGDRGPGTPGARLPSLTLATTAALNLDSAAPASAFTGAPTGTPGSRLTLDAGSVSIAGTELRASAGSLQINSATGISVSSGALLATPAYSRTFGDAADPTTVSAPGGFLGLTALGGDIGVSSDSTLAIGGAQGQAGSLALIAQNGAVLVHGPSPDTTDLTSVVSAGAPGAGASLTLDAGRGGFDLDAFARGLGSAFTGAVSIRSGQGDLTLGAGHALKAASVQIVADGGQVADSGLIDTSGVNGGDVSLFGATGVKLAATAVIDTQAKGYGLTDTRSASGGSVSLGTDLLPGSNDSGAIQVDSGAVINVSALNTENRIVPLSRSQGLYYSFVAGDVGGTVTFRAPLVTDSTGASTVDVNVAGAVQGASRVVLEGFKHFDLSKLTGDQIDPATGLPYEGVSVSGTTATLDLGATAAGKVNALGYAFDAQGAIVNGPVVNFVQSFSSSVVVPGSLTALPNFHAQPGVELDYSGDIVLSSNWNLGAGVLSPANQAAAVQTGLLTEETALETAAGPKVYAVAPGADGQLLANYIRATYRTGGTFAGEPGILTLRAGGALTLNGSVTDGFYQFRDQTDPNYLNFALGGGNRTYQGSVATTCSGGCVSIPAWSASGTGAQTVKVVIPTASIGLTADPYTNPTAPYSAQANSPAASGDAGLTTGTGDPLGSAQIFPLLPNGGSVGSWSYRLVAGANLNGAATTGAPGSLSVDPMVVAAGSQKNVVVQGEHVYGYQASAGTTRFAPSLNIQDNQNGASLTPDAWYQAMLSENPDLTPDSYTTIVYLAPKNAKQFDQLLANFFKLNPKDPGTVKANKVTTTLAVARDLLAYISQNFGPYVGQYSAPGESVDTTPVYAVAPTLVRTGSGSIAIAASGNIDLRNGATATILDQSTGTLAAATVGGTQLGGAAVYTAGTLAQLGVTTAVDVTSGGTVTVNLSAGASAEDNFGSLQTNPYYYGAKVNGSASGSIAGVLVADPVYLQGGGSVSLTAGVDVLSRRDTDLENRIGVADYPSILAPAFPWIGGGAQPWRTGSIGGGLTKGFVVQAQIDPQLFAEGVGTLGGGNISVNAGRDIVDLSTIATDSLTTASIGQAAAPNAIVTLGGGDVRLQAGGNLFGGRLDVASGQASVVVGGSLAAAGLVDEASAMVDNTLRVRLADATVDILASGDVTLQGIAGLGLNEETSNIIGQSLNHLNSSGFYSNAAGVSIVADGGVNIANTGYDVVTTGIDNTTSAVYPGSFAAVSMTGNLDVATAGRGLTTQPSEVLLYPTPTGSLTLLADGDIERTTIAQLDNDPTLLPGVFSQYSQIQNSSVSGGLPFDFPTVLSDTSDVALRNQHKASITHASDPTPNRIAAGGDIVDMILSTAKQTRIEAGRDIVNMAFFGQNVAAGDVTRIAAGRDITATTALLSPYVKTSGGVENNEAALPAIQGDTFILGGPGDFFVEAGRDAGPFLNSAVTNGYNSGSAATATGVLTFGNGILTIGNLWNPWLPSQGANIVTEFGVGKGQDFANLVSTYLNPAAFASQPDYLFEQTTNASGVAVADRSQEIYALSLPDWFRSIAPTIVAAYDTTTKASAPGPNAPALVQYAQRLMSGGSTTTAEALSFLPQVAEQRMPLIPWLQLHAPSQLVADYGTLDVTYQQAFTVFSNLPALVQRQYLIKNVYFNELVQTSVPTSPSYLKYSRGYTAVNTLFPASLGYTQNSLNGGPAGASTTVSTGNLDLRLATIQTAEGGDISILGPGGRVLAGSTVSTSVQASRRVYNGGAVYAGGDFIYPLAAKISQIPVGYEGVITLRGGSIESFTDGDFLLNQSRAFTVDGGDIAVWSSNADVNAGQGPRTTPDVAPVIVTVDADGYTQENTSGAVSGAGIAAFRPDAADLAPAVYLIAPRGTVDAGDAGVRSAGDVFIAAFQVANSDAIQASGAISGVQTTAAINVGAQTSGDAAASAAAQAAQAAAGSQGGGNDRPLIFVDVLGFLGGEVDADDQPQRKKH